MCKLPHILQDTFSVEPVHYKFASSHEKATVIALRRKGVAPIMRTTQPPAACRRIFP